MSLTQITAGFMPLIDAAPLIMAKEMGFAEEEGLDLELRPAPSWSTLRDMLAYGQIEAAHMLSPVPVASSIGLLNGLPRLQALSVLSTNGSVIGVSPDMSRRLEQAGYGFDFKDAYAAGQAVAQLPRPLRVGVPFILSMHTELMTLWLNAAGLTEGQDFQIQAVPPPLISHAIRSGELDLFCVGEPWGSVTVETADGSLILPSSEIWSATPEKVLATRENWVDGHKDTALALLRAVWRAGQWMSNPGKQTALAEVLARKCYLGTSSEMVDRALTGHLVINSRGDQRQAAQFVEFHKGCVNFPWKSQADWIATQLAKRFQIDLAPHQCDLHKVFRSDLYRHALGDLGVDLPLASAKVEGGQEAGVEVRSVSGSMILAQNRFFDGRIFDPDA